MALTINGTTGIETNTDTGKLKFGTGDDLEIYHNGSHSYIKNTGTGNLYIEDAGTIRINTDSFAVQKNDGSESILSCTADAGVDIYYDNTKRFEVVSDGIRWTGHCYANDNYKLRLGTGEDLQIYHDGTNSFIDNNTGELRLDSASAVKTFHNGTLISYTESDRLRFNDNLSVAFGNASDLKLFHNGQHSFIENNEGNLYIWNGNGHDKNIVIQATYGEESIICEHNGGVKLYNDNSKKFETNSNGIEVFDNVKCTGNRGTHYAFSAYGTTSTGSQYYMTFRRSDDTHDGYIVSTSDGAISLAQGSDYRLKENIVSMTNGIDIVKKLNPVTYKFKGKTDTLQGFIAHEVDDAGILNGVIGTKDAVDSDNKPIYQGVSVDKLIPALTAGLKEAIAKIETLETKVAALEAA